MREASAVVVYLPPWRIDVQSRPGVPRLVPVRELARAIAATLNAAGAPTPASIGLILSDDRELAKLNVEHLGHEEPTDVLSFPLLLPSAFPAHSGQDPQLRRAAAPFALPPGRRVHLGDIVVSVERAVEQATEGRGAQTGDRRWSPADELRLLVTHGALHICGWDHVEPTEETAMRALERQLLGMNPPD
jgi:probable rRNA maturation factor